MLTESLPAYNTYKDKYDKLKHFNVRKYVTYLKEEYGRH